MDNIGKYESLIDTVIDGRYRVISIRGIGGMAVVLKAEDTHMHRTVALKLLSDEFSSDDDILRRFVNESKAVALLDHEHIVSIYDVAFKSKFKYIVMEYLDGLTLKEYILKQGKLSVDEALNLTAQILSALEHAHSKGVIHRDIKPQNILLVDGKAKVADFGIAKTPDSNAIANSEKAMGTVHYISPEQAAGNPTGFYSDLYSVGIMLYEMVTGRLPFEADTPLAIAMMQLNNEPTPPRKIDTAIPKGLEQIILKSMAKKPGDRFKSARSMLRAVQIIIDKPNAVFEDRPKAVKNLPNEEEGGKKKLSLFKKLFGRTNPNVRYQHGPRTLFPIILGVFSAFVLVAGVVGAIFLISFFNGSMSNFGYSQKVPDLVGRTYNETLVGELSANNYSITEIKYVYDQSYTPNTVMEQEPKAGTTRKTSQTSKKIELVLTVSMGEESVPIPDVSMLDYREAQILLEERGLKVQISQEYSETAPEGKVLSTLPAAGSYAGAGDTITLRVSRGQDVVMGKVPNLVGLSLSDAQKLVLENNFEIGKITREPSEQQSGTVLSQSIAPDTLAAKNHTKIDIVLSIQKPQ